MMVEYVAQVELTSVIEVSVIAIHHKLQLVMYFFQRQLQGNVFQGQVYLEVAWVEICATVKSMSAVSSLTRRMPEIMVVFHFLL